MDGQEKQVLTKLTVGGKSVKGSGSKSALWDTESIDIFVKVCLEQVRRGNRDCTYFNKIYWNYIVQNFNTRTGKNYDKKQIKNRWIIIKTDWML